MSNTQADFWKIHWREMTEREKAQWRPLAVWIVYLLE